VRHTHQDQSVNAPNYGAFFAYGIDAGRLEEGVIHGPKGNIMVQGFEVGDHVTWNSEAGHVRGNIIKVHTKNVNHNGYTHHASEDDPQYEIKSDKTDHIAMHKGSVLTKVSD
jgi:hypothetical protein